MINAIDKARNLCSEIIGERIMRLNETTKNDILFKLLFDDDLVNVVLAKTKLAIEILAMGDNSNDR